ncbi:MAG: EFR1 family ferrodoxin [Candidatus Helarchaeota archaeon]
MRLRSVIFFFSQQGSTKKIAEKIAEGLRSEGDPCDLVQFTKLSKDLQLIRNFNFKKYHLIGIGTPVYYFHPPYHLFEVFDSFPNLSHATGFLFCTSGGNPGATLYKIKQIMDRKGLKIIDGYDGWIGLDQHRCYSHFPDSALPKSIGHPTAEELHAAREFGRKLIKKALNPTTPEKTDFWTKDNVWARGGWKGRSAPFMERWFPEFRLNKEKCTQCGECAARCPVEAIQLDPYPVWIRDCDRCYLCDLYCPEQAIECDWSRQTTFMDEILARAKKKETKR